MDIVQYSYQNSRLKEYLNAKENKGRPNSFLSDLYLPKIIEKDPHAEMNQKLQQKIKDLNKNNQNLKKINDGLKDKLNFKEDQIKQKDLRIFELQKHQLILQNRIKQIQCLAQNLKKKEKYLQDTIKDQQKIIEKQRIENKLLKDENIQYNKIIQQLQQQIEELNTVHKTKKRIIVPESKQFKDTKDTKYKKERQQNRTEQEPEQPKQPKQSKSAGRIKPKLEGYLAQKLMTGQTPSDQFLEYFIKQYNKYQQKDLGTSLTQHLKKRLNGIYLIIYQLINQNIYKKTRVLAGAKFQNDKIITQRQKLNRLNRTNDNSQFRSKTKDLFHLVEQDIKLSDISHKHSAHIYGFNLQFVTAQDCMIQEKQNYKTLYQNIIRAFQIVIGQVVPQPAANNISFQRKIDQLQVFVIDNVLKTFIELEKPSECKIQLKKKIVWLVDKQFKRFIQDKQYKKYIQKNQRYKWYNKFHQIVSNHIFQFVQQQFFPYKQYMSEQMKNILFKNEQKKEAIQESEAKLTQIKTNTQNLNDIK